MCARGIVTKPVPSQESDWSCICVLGVSIPNLYQARKGSGHVCVLGLSTLLLSEIVIATLFNISSIYLRLYILIPENNRRNISITTYHMSIYSVFQND